MEKLNVTNLRQEFNNAIYMHSQVDEIAENVLLTAEESANNGDSWVKEVIGLTIEDWRHQQHNLINERQDYNCSILAWPSEDSLYAKIGLAVIDHLNAEPTNGSWLNPEAVSMVGVVGQEQFGF